MQPDDQRKQDTLNNTFASNDPPVYPTADFYRELAAKGPPPNQNAAAPTPAPYLAPVQRPLVRNLPGHNRAYRFIYNWGGTQRMWLSLGSAVLSVFVDMYIFHEGWQFGVGFVLMLLIHELGHDFALLRKKLPATFPIFIPGMGAFVTLPNKPISMRDDAEISLAGPLAGGLVALFFFIMSLITFDDLWYQLAFYSFLINLLNLIPILPLDGGHIGRVLSPIFAPIGLAIIGGLYLLTHNFFFILLGFYGLSGMMGGVGSGGRIMSMRNADKVIVGIMYASVVIMLALGFWAVNNAEIYLWFLPLHLKLFS